MKPFRSLLLFICTVIAMSAFCLDKFESIEAVDAALASEPPMVAKMDIRQDSNPKFLLNGKPVDAMLYNCPWSWSTTHKPFIEKMDNFRAGDINLYCVGVAEECWNADGTVNYNAVREKVYQPLLNNPDAYLNVAISFNVPPEWWMDENPDELTGYAIGKPDPAMTDSVQNSRSPSYASEKWSRDVTKFISEVVTYLESLPISKRIFSYQVNQGVYREWHYTGMRANMPDVSRPMLLAFRKYLSEKYSTDEALQKAWNNPDVTLATAEIPDKNLRNATIFNGGGLRDPIEHASVIDFLHCMQYAMRDLLLACDKAVKDACNYNKLVGNYFGYLFGMHYPVEAWHLELDNVLDSNVVDWNASPNVYTHRDIENAEFGRSAVESYTLRGKLNIQEHDSRTHLVPGNYYCHAANAEQSVSILARDFGQSLCRNAGFWFLDFGTDWYNDPLIFDFFRKIKPILKLADHNPPASEVAIIADLESVYYHRISTTYIDLMFDCNCNELTHSGTPFDVLYLNDLENPKVRDYKVYVIANLFYLTPEKKAIIEKLRKAGKNIVWLYAPGYLNADGHDVKNIKDLTGFSVFEQVSPRGGRAFLLSEEEMMPDSDITMGPNFLFDDKQAKMLAYKSLYDKYEPCFASRKEGDAMEYYSTMGFLSRTAWKDIFRECGVHNYEASGKPVIWASESFISINGLPGTYTITLPRPRTVKQVFPEMEAPVADQTSIQVELTDKVGTRIFYLE